MNPCPWVISEKGSKGHECILRTKHHQVSKRHDVTQKMEGCENGDMIPLAQRLESDRTVPEEC